MTKAAEKMRLLKVREKKLRTKQFLKETLQLSGGEKMTDAETAIAEALRFSTPIPGEIALKEFLAQFDAEELEAEIALDLKTSLSPLQLC
jgi:hypothetical protein